MQIEIQFCHRASNPYVVRSKEHRPTASVMIKRKQQPTGDQSLPSKQLLTTDWLILI